MRFPLKWCCVRFGTTSTIWSWCVCGSLSCDEFCCSQGSRQVVSKRCTNASPVCWCMTDSGAFHSKSRRRVLQPQKESVQGCWDTPARPWPATGATSNWRCRGKNREFEEGPGHALRSDIRLLGRQSLRSISRGGADMLMTRGTTLTGLRASFLQNVCTRRATRFCAWWWPLLVTVHPRLVTACRQRWLLSAFSVASSSPKKPQILRVVTPFCPRRMAPPCSKELTWAWPRSYYVDTANEVWRWWLHHRSEVKTEDRLCHPSVPSTTTYSWRSTVPSCT